MDDNPGISLYLFIELNSKIPTVSVLKRCLYFMHFLISTVQGMANDSTGTSDPDRICSDPLSHIGDFAPLTLFIPS